MTQSTFVYHHSKKNIDIFLKMCNAKLLSTILTGVEIGCYVVAIGIEISFGPDLFIPLPIIRGLLIPFLIMEIFGNQRQRYGIILCSCIFRALKFILAIVFLVLLYTHPYWIAV